jgi:hypothetical protein
MRYRICGAGWPVGQYLIPTGTVLDFSKPDMWTKIAEGLAIPINATPLDEEAHEAQLKAHSNHRYLLGPLEGKR